MNLTALDWGIVLVLLVTLFGAAFYTNRYAKSVSTFLAAGRCGGRYLIAMAFAAAGTGVISLVYWFEIYYEAGYPAYWWSSLTEPALIVIALSGWIVYRFRQTRALTLAQFFETRYSRNFRVFAGLVAFISGLVNFGIYPAVGARFFIALCGLPTTVHWFGTDVQTYILLMVLLLTISLVFTFQGGQVTVMVTDFIQGAFANIVFVLLIGYLLGSVFRWDQIADVLLQAPEGHSLVHPLKMGGQNDFNLSYFLIAVAIVFYTFNSWQGTSGYNASARSAHEAKMAGILYGWRFRVLLTVTIVIPLAVLTLERHPDFAAQAAQLKSALDGIAAPTEEQRTTLQGQLRVPYALALLLPPGLLGLVVASMLALFISTHDTYLHSWGSIFLQDVVLPFRKEPFTPKTHLRVLRLSIFGVALFIFFFSILVKPTQFIAMFFAITGAIFVSGAGAVIIGGLYWKRGTARGAWAALVTGMVISSTGVFVKQLDPSTVESLSATAPWLGSAVRFLKDGLTGQELTGLAMASSIIAYVLGSLLGPKQVTDMDRLLHRGAYAVEAEINTPGPVEESEKGRSMPRRWLARLGIDREFSRGDRWVAYVSIAWPLLWTGLFFVVTIWNLTTEVPDSWWVQFWRVWTWVFSAGALAVTVWFTIGGAKDLRYLVRHLANFVPDPTDDGRVIGGGDASERGSAPGVRPDADSNAGPNAHPNAHPGAHPNAGPDAHPDDHLP
ncbi:MAG: sodium:solute symporter [Candidatus Eisenbacteria bacterium]